MLAFTLVHVLSNLIPWRKKVVKRDWYINIFLVNVFAVVVVLQVLRSQEVASLDSRLHSRGRDARSADAAVVERFEVAPEVDSRRRRGAHVGKG